MRARTQVMASAVQVHQDITKSGQRISRHLEAWRRWGDIWKTDKATLLDKFKAKAPGCAAFVEKFTLFKKVRLKG
jgi:dynein heavy chain